ncbi:SWIM zinc finger domain-containing protein [bacterium]|nr:SWIM zinc finger domain-containing protein [bacterium]
MIQILQEVTDWGKFKVNNGIYHINGAGSLVAYQVNVDAKLQVLKSPSKQFSKSRRKFVKLGERPEELASHIIEVKGSKGNVYYVDTEKNTCTCPGFTFRGNCKHIK